ncbi:hypothetical protein H4W31_002453 [Plantactinospora soyae]|uniref:Uncharacterized protein n=1 Tax=Plantactinospora soyae TaxID=1544732 RepID=A0A927M4T2_9ACTN|nr:hypothetical protein [Plantactinospora soyae]
MSWLRHTPERHRRDWRRLWRYCRCGLRWGCPDWEAVAALAPIPPPSPQARPADPQVAPDRPTRLRSRNQRYAWDDSTGQLPARVEPVTSGRAETAPRHYP